LEAVALSMSVALSGAGRYGTALPVVAPTALSVVFLLPEACSSVGVPVTALSVAAFGELVGS
jgi:hypothetical protein